jgi:hypothetical protein
VALPSKPKESTMKTTGIAATVALASAFTSAGAAPALATETAVTREHRVVENSGVLTTCADGTDVQFSSVADRYYTTWWRDGAPVREHRHIDFVGTLSKGSITMPYTGVWNRDEDLLSGDIRITGGQFRVSLPDGPTLVGGGIRADGNEFKGTGDRFVVDLCTALGGE